MIDFNVIEAEILACAGLCINDFNNEIKDILLVNSTNTELVKMLTKFHAKVHCVGMKRESFGEGESCGKKVAFYDLAINLKVHKFDLIIDLATKSAENYQKLLKDNGILIVNLADLRTISIKNLNLNLNIMMPFKILRGESSADLGADSSDFSANRSADSKDRTADFGDRSARFALKYYLFASNKFHPLADLSLQKLDLLDDLKYCNDKIYQATFAMPNLIKSALKGVARN